MAETLASLPTEILLRICKSLGQIDRPSLVSFALASKLCHSVSKPALFGKLTFSITTPARLRAHSQKCIHLLERNQAFDHVRCIVLANLSLRQGFDTQAFLCNSQREEQDRFDLHRWNLADAPCNVWPVNHQRLLSIPDHSDSNLPIRAGQPSVKAAYDMDAAWAPLADLIRLLPGLADLIYECPGQFPPCLLKALHDKAPNHITRLHLHTFSLWMLPLDPAAAVIVDPHELALITSPCLHSIWLRSNDEAEALEKMMENGGLVPNLREVRMFLPPIPNTSLHPTPPPPRSWDWLPAEIGARNGQRQVVPLQHLERGASWSLYNRFSGDEFQWWTRLFDLGALQTLDLAAMVDESALDMLLSLRCPALTTLAFRCTERPSPSYLDKAWRFIRGLPRLESLHLINWDWSAATTLADPDSARSSNTPNTTLRTLWLQNTTPDKRFPTATSEPQQFSLPSPSALTSLGALFPSIDTLSICVRRSSGDSAEVARYRVLGAAFPLLKRLALVLVPPAEPQTPPDPESTAFEDQTPPLRTRATNGHVMRVMANVAVDAELARQVFLAVGAPALETMLVKADDDAMGSVGLARGQWVHGLARAWRVDRRVDSGEGGFARLEVRQIWKNEEAWRLGTAVLGLSELDPFLVHFRRLWPGRKEGSEGWFDDWESCYLVKEG